MRSLLLFAFVGFAFANLLPDIPAKEDKPMPKPEDKPELKPEAIPEAIPEVKPEVMPELKPDPMAELKPEAKPEEPLPSNPASQPTPDDLARAMLGVMIMRPVAYEASELKKNDICAMGTPHDGFCDKNQDCAKGFKCVEHAMDEKDPMYAEYKDKKVCCLANDEVAMHWKCPAMAVPAKNKFCSEDSDCGELATCHKQFVMPSEIAEDLEKGTEERRVRGICCSERDIMPAVLDHCPKNYQPTRRAPCGLGLADACEIGSSCVSPKEDFGRCCRHADSDSKTGNSNLFYHSAYYRPSYFHSPYYGGYPYAYSPYGYSGYGYGYRPFYGGYGGYHRHFGGYGRGFYGHRHFRG